MSPRLLTVMIAVILSGFSAHAQMAKWGTHVDYSGDNLIPYRKGDLWGYSDSSGNVVIEPKYAHTYFFVGKLAFFSNTQQHSPDMTTGILTRDGKVLVEPVDYMKSFIISDSTALIMEGENYIIDYKGNKTPFTYHDFNSYFYFHSEDFYRAGISPAQNDNGFFIIDATGKTLAGPLSDFTIIKPFNDGLAPATRSDGSQVYIDRTGKIAPGTSDIKYVSGFAYVNRLANITIQHRNGNEYDLRSTPVISYSIPEELWPVKEGVAILYKDGKPGLLDTLGNILVPFGKYESIDDFYEGLSRVVHGGKVSFIDRTGKEVIAALPYTDVERFFDGLARVHNGEHYAFIDTKGKVAFELKGMEGVGNFSEGLCRVEMGNGRGFINKKGKFEIKPKLYYETIHDFHEGLCLVDHNDYWAFIDRKGKEVFRLNRENYGVSSFHNGVAEIELTDGKRSLVGRDGKILPYTYAADSRWTADGFRVVAETGTAMHGVVNKKQELIAPLEFKHITILSNRLAETYDDKTITYYHLGTRKKLAKD